LERQAVEVEEGGSEEERQGPKEEGKAKGRTPHGGAVRGKNKGVAFCGMMKAAKPNHPTTRKDAVGKYITQHVPRTFITFEQTL